MIDLAFLTFFSPSDLIENYKSNYGKATKSELLWEKGHP